MALYFELKDHVARVTIDRPDRMNAVDAATHKELEGIWDQVERDSSIRCVVLTGAGDKAFCAGANLKDRNGPTGVDYWSSFSFGGISLRSGLNTPIIARVNGVALGGGMEMVLGCDIVIAAETAQFGLPEARIGRVPLDGGMNMLQRLIPRNVANGVMMAGRMLGAAEMHAYGLVNAVVPLSDLDAEVDRWVQDVLACAPLSVRAIKAL